MQDQFREGDWVRHRSFPEPVRVIGIGTTIAVELPNADMRAFEPEELEKVSITSVSVRKVRLHERRRNGHGAEQFALVTIVSLIYLVMLVLDVIAGAGRM